VTDALDRATSVLVLGGTSAIALATVRALRSPALRHVVLAGRPSPKLDAAVSALVAEGLVGTSAVDFDAADTHAHDAMLASVFSESDIDVVLVAFGVLGDQEDFESDPDLAVRAAQVNYVGGVSVCLRSARLLRGQGHGSLVVLSSVAGERPRRNNFVYGSTKAGLDALAGGLADALEGSGARVLVVRPGFVRTSMTAHLEPAPLSVSAEEVAEAVVSGLRGRATVVYAPPVMRLVMSGLRHLPRAVFRRLPI
jgi:decaprenylphospho-beta-D-erythro-pentofuranosid-2-ulose 2-reductase